jgi:hypothetical protein
MSQTIQDAAVDPTACDVVVVARTLGVDPARGLTAGEAASRLASRALTFSQWCICVGIASSLVVVEELTKLVIRHRGDLSSSANSSAPQAHPLTVTAATT